MDDETRKISRAEQAEVMSWWAGHIESDEKLSLVDESIMTSILTDDGPVMVLEKPITLEAGYYIVAMNMDKGETSIYRVEKK